MKKANEKLNAVLAHGSGIQQLLESHPESKEKIEKMADYLYELRQLQIEFTKLQQWVNKRGLRVAVLFEGRDAAGKGSAIQRFTEYLNPRSARTVALPKPSDVERGQWYFQRYAKQLPNKGEITFFDRSWYNRAVVEPVMGFCTEEEYHKFLDQVPDFECLLLNDGIILIKMWFAISKKEQKKRFEARQQNPLKSWKYSPVDEVAQERWDDYTRYIKNMLAETHSQLSPWYVVRANNKKRARLEAMRFVLSKIEYAGKNHVLLEKKYKKEIVLNYVDALRYIG
jgi:polyphosphate kinase 2